MDIAAEIPKRHVLTVSELTSLIKSTLEKTFYDVWVEGEIYNLRVPTSGHVYFTLKDNSSQIKAVLFRSSARLLKFIPQDGMHVLCSGRITIYEFRGEYQVVVDYMEPKGVGALLIAFEQLKERLSAEGLFDDARKRPIPVLPKKIGIVTSPTGAAIRDILKVIDRRFANVEIIIAPASVQGERAAPEIVEAIAELNNIEDIDVLIVARGGGGMEDLWPFNEEIVARAIYHSGIPVISAVGHEIDYTIADFVSDLRAPTPSAAAEMVVKNKEDIQNHLRNLYERLVYTQRIFLEKRRERLHALCRRVLSPEKEINRHLQRLDEIETRLCLGMERRIKDKRHHIEGLVKEIFTYNPRHHILLCRHRVQSHAASLLKNYRHSIELRKKALHGVISKLDSLSPLAILARGYSITRKLPSLSVVRSSADVQHGERVDIRLHEGRIVCVVEDVSR